MSSEVGNLTRELLLRREKSPAGDTLQPGTIDHVAVSTTHNYLFAIISVTLPLFRNATD